MINPAFAKLLAEMAVFLEMSGDNPFRIRAYQKAVQTIEDYPVDLGSLAREDLLKIPGIGQGIADKIQEFAKTGRVREHDGLLKKYPAGLMEIMRVPGLGPKRARFLYEELQVDSCAKLAKLAAAGKLSGLKGFGAKMQENIVKGLQSAARGDGRMLLWKARKLMAPLLAKLAEVRGVTAVEPAGSLRRGRETVGDLDILCASRQPEAVIEFFTKMPSVLRVLAAGDKKASVLFYDNVQCDLRVVDPSVFGAALQYFTGSKEHNVVLRERAQRLGLTVNEYGVFRLSDKKQLKPLAAEKEEDVYKVLGLQYIPPELRENRGEIEAAEKKRLPRLVEEKDIKGCFHNHTDASDGADTLEAMAEAARAQGW
ncbi:MAG: helix-hairpin-helix domain-containing protein, partial [Elusimicrobiota bacterium]